MGNAVFDFVGRESGAEFEDLDVVRFDAGPERGEIDVARPGRTMVPSRKLDIVNVKTGEMIAQRFQVEDVVDETKIFFNLRVAGVVPVDEGRAVDVTEKKLIIGFDG